MLVTKKYDSTERKRLISVCMGLEDADLMLAGGYVIDVAVGEIRRADIAVKDKRVAYVGDVGKVRAGPSTNLIDMTGKYLAPGLLDSHAHVESTMLTSSAYASLVLRCGTTGAVIDPHEVANVSGLEGVRALLKDANNTPFKFYVQIPSCVPSAPGLETSGCTLDASAIEMLQELEDVWGLGEMMSYDKVLGGDNETLGKIRLAYERGMVVDGHSPLLRGERFQAYASSGVMTDHTSRTEEEVLERLRSGVHTMIQDRPGESSFEAIVDVLKKVDTRRAMFCTDDIEPDEVEERGHVVSLVRKAVDLGLDPIKAVQMATLNVAETYLIESELGIIAPGRYADLVIFHDLKEFTVDKVFANGSLAVSQDVLLIERPKPDFQRFRHTVKLRQDLTPEDFLLRVKLKSGRSLARVVTVDGELMERELEVSDHHVAPNPADDTVRMAVLERHGRNGNIGKGFISGTGLKRGAIASSISHDAHNLVCIGVSENDMYQAVREVEKVGGGMVAVMSGGVLAKVELPFFGLLSDDLNVCKAIKELRKAVLDMGLKIPFRKLMFLSLPVGRGNYKITDIGLVNYAEKEVLSPLVSLSS